MSGPQDGRAGCPPGLTCGTAALGVLGRLSHTSGGGGASILVWLIVVAIAVVVGLYFGRIRGLRHLGEAEFRTRVTNIRRIGRF